MNSDCWLNIDSLNVDGGATSSDFLMQFQADILGISVFRPSNIEVTSKGAAFLSGLAVDLWDNQKEIKALQLDIEEFKPKMSEECRKALYDGWKAAMGKALSSKGYKS